MKTITNEMIERLNLIVTDLKSLIDTAENEISPEDENRKFLLNKLYDLKIDSEIAISYVEELGEE